MAFPKELSGKIMNIVRELQEFGTVNEFKYSISDPQNASAPDFDDSGWTSYSGGKPPFKRDQGVTWVRTSYTVPESCKDISLKGSELRIIPGATGGAYFSPVQIYSDGKLLLKEDAWMDCKCPEGIITENAEPGRKHIIAVRLDLNEKSFWEPNLPMAIYSDAIENYVLHFESIVSELSYVEDFNGACEILPKAYKLLEAAVNKSCKALMDAIAECRKLCEPLRSQAKRDKVYLVTHAHIDMNWFWPIEETKRIVDRDFVTMTTLMEENPDFKFSQSQAATYEMEEEQNPAVFKKMQNFVQNGQWDITASTWTEGDLNMASGESIARHALYSKKYIAEKFNGNEPKIMWCPDTFGHPANIPQILKKSGLDYYYHTRCGINVDYTLFESFDYLRDAKHVPLYWWKGQDGSRVLVCNTVYGREFSTGGVTLMAENMRKRFGYNKSMFVFGVGDHGGGPTRRDIAWMREISKFPTVPTVLFSSTKEFYDQVVMDNPILPEHCGELNFVFDGCYTTHADTKYYNRKCENELEAVEALCAMASLHGFEYPRADFEKYWKVVLFNQFHDILDGSGVQDTYLYSNEESEKSLKGLKAIEEKALVFLASKVKAAEVPLPAAGKKILLYNTTFARRNDCVFVPCTGNWTALDEQGAVLPTQKVENGVLVFASMPPMGFKIIHLTDAQESPCTAICEDEDFYRISTDYYDIEIQKSSGRITTLYDKDLGRFIVRRETIGFRLKNGCLNTLEVHYEEPTPMSSWTIGNIRNIKRLIDGAKSSIVEDGPVRKCIRFEHALDSSTITQDILIYPDSRRIDFKTYVNWKEYGNFDRDAPMLKVSFTPDIQNTAATYEIPFGVLERRTGDYEYPGLRFADISDSNGGRSAANGRSAAMGFAVLNDSKYGYKCAGNRMELTLIRSGWLPDQKSDIGEHNFTYSIMSHPDCYLDGGVIAQAAFLNNPARAVEIKSGGSDGLASSLFTPECDCIPINGVKRSEDGAAIVLKLYNTTDECVKTQVKAGFDIGSVSECDFLENPINTPVVYCKGSFTVELGPREIKSFRVAACL